MATEKQINYCLSLLSRHGYSIRFMDSRMKDFGATMRERSGSVTDWLKTRSQAEISAIIARLK